MSADRADDVPKFRVGEFVIWNGHPSALKIVERAYVCETAAGSWLTLVESELHTIEGEQT